VYSIDFSALIQGYWRQIQRN